MQFKGTVLRERYSVLNCFIMLGVALGLNNGPPTGFYIFTIRCQRTAIFQNAILTMYVDSVTLSL